MRRLRVFNRGHLPAGATKYWADGGRAVCMDSLLSYRGEHGDWSNIQTSRNDLDLRTIHTRSEYVMLVMEEVPEVWTDHGTVWRTVDAP